MNIILPILALNQANKTILRKITMDENLSIQKSVWLCTSLSCNITVCLYVLDRNAKTSINNHCPMLLKGQWLVSTDTLSPKYSNVTQANRSRVLYPWSIER